jgi:hypothetical protein
MRRTLPCFRRIALREKHRRLDPFVDVFSLPRICAWRLISHVIFPPCLDDELVCKKRLSDADDTLVKLVQRRKPLAVGYRKNQLNRDRGGDNIDGDQPASAQHLL